MNLYDFATPVRISMGVPIEEIIRMTNLYNGITNCYRSVNPYNEDGKVLIERCFFDFDDSVEDVKIFVKYLIEKDIKFSIYFSGHGWHIYVYCKGIGNASNLRVLQLFLLNEAKVMCDPHVLGDLQRVSRIPNTWNFSAEKFCIPIKIEDLGNENSSSQQECYNVYGNEIINLEEYTEDHYDYLKPEIVPNLHISGDILLIPCMKNIVSKINPRHDERFLLAVYLSFAVRNGKDLYCFNSKDIIEKILDFMKMNCQHWLDFNEGKTRYYLNNIIPKFNPLVNCKFIKAKGCCIECGLKEREL